jgi:hypothetical protein
MSYKRLIYINVMSQRYWLIPTGLLALLAVVAALFGPQPVYLSLVLFLIISLGWLAHTLGFYKVSDSRLILIIFEDGRVRLESDCKGTIGGFLEGQQWCTSHAAVLRVVVEGKTRYLVTLSAQQHKADVFRRLNMWLRQDFCRGDTEKQMLGS